ncbi:MAG TPA: hypothetical protein VHN98_05310 [Acidimicrobiales bacterium]|nr:hypothetical protein [Acidimicrobiales bacterium]
MLARAATASLFSLREERDRIVAAAERPDDAAERQRRLHETRGLRLGTARDGAGTGTWRVTPETQAELMALLAPFIERQFAAARREGRREGAGAYAADALVDLARTAYARHTGCGDPSPCGGASAEHDDRAGGPPATPDADDDTTADPAAAGGAAAADAPDTSGRPSPASGSTSTAAPVSPKVPAKIIVRLDHSALLRGHTIAGETCEVAGVGPVPVDTVTRLLATGDVFWAAVVTRGVDVVTVAHLGRRPSAAQLTALHWRDPACREETCARPVREWDHHLDWACTHHTLLGELGGFCEHHHDLKTYRGYRLARSRLPGKVRLLPPDTADPPSPT